MNEIPKEYFLSADDDLVDYLEKQGEESLKETLKSNATNIENGYKLLSIQIVGIGSAFLLLTQKTSWDFLAVGIAVFTFLWTWCAIYLVCSGLSVKLRAQTFSPPDCLYTEKYKHINDNHYQAFESVGYKGDRNVLSVIRRYHLVDLSDTSRELLELNHHLRTSLDRARILTILTPVVSIIASAITFCLS